MSVEFASVTVQTESLIMGLDVSLTATGWAILIGGELTTSGVIHSWPSENRIARYLQITDEILTAMPVGADVAIEGYAYMAAGDAVTKLAELGGILRYRLMELGIEPVEISPGTWRKAVLGKGNLVKDQVRLEAYKRYQVDIADHNALEAFCVAKCLYLQQTGQAKPPIKKGRKSDTSQV